jgi:hypothetical protein
MKRPVVVATLVVAIVSLVGCARTTKPSESWRIRTVPQSEEWSPVRISVEPSRVKPGGTFRLQSTLLAGEDPEATFLATNVILDQEVNGVWKAAWILGSRGQSFGPEANSSPPGLEADAIGVGRPLTFTLAPPPPAGRYRVRISVSGPTRDAPQPGRQSYWSFADLEVLPSG